jgi:uncharacterized protein (TIGR03435 family)
MNRAIAWSLAVLLSVTAVAQESKPKFDVASVRSATPGETGGRVQFLPGRLRAQNVSLDFLIQQTYGIRDYQVVAAPEWRAIIGDGYGRRYYIDATGDPSANEQSVKEMTKTLLAERFALRLHTEKRELPVYQLNVAKGGAKGARAADGPPGGIGIMASGWIRGEGVTPLHFVNILSRYLDRPVIDGTNLSGVLDFDLTWTPQDALLLRECSGTRFYRR